jgi:hypothetical protein
VERQKQEDRDMVLFLRAHFRASIYESIAYVPLL